MRIIGEIPHAELKITVFKNDGRISVKVEAGLLEQHYKFRADDALQTFEDAQRLLDSAWLRSTEAAMRQMYAARQTALTRFLPTDIADEFDKII
jgi:hypothetical protein